MSQRLGMSALGRESTPEGPETQAPTRLARGAAEGTWGHLKLGWALCEESHCLFRPVADLRGDFLSQAVVAFFQAPDMRLQNEQSFLQTSSEP